jgi:hypothetical protein
MVMEQRNIVTQTMTNMYNIYNDIGRIIRVIEEETKNSNLIAVGGDATVTWENSYAYYRPEAWLPSWFARAYQTERFENRAVGFCIHLGGERYDSVWQEKLEAAQIHFPFINISLIEMDTKIREVKRSNLNDIFWSAGWYEPWWVSNIENESLVFSQEKEMDGNSKLITYFLDLFTLNSKDTVLRLVVEPMVQMLAGDIDWVINNKLPVIKITPPSFAGE